MKNCWPSRSDSALTDQPSSYIRRTAARKADEDAHRPRRIGLRLRDPRHGREARQRPLPDAEIFGGEVSDSSRACPPGSALVAREYAVAMRVRCQPTACSLPVAMIRISARPGSRAALGQNTPLPETDKGWKSTRPTGFPNRHFSDLWEVGFWRTDHAHHHDGRGLDNYFASIRGIALKAWRQRAR